MRGVLVRAALLLCAAPPAGAADRTLFDFEEEKLSLSWTAGGEIRASRTEVPETPPRTRGPGGHGVAVEAGAGARLASRPGTAAFDWSEHETLEFWAHRSAAEAAAHPATTLDVRLVEEDGRTWFWRKVVLDHVGWTEVRAPLRYFRWRRGARVPRWDRITSVAFSFRDDAALHLDAITVVDVGGGPGTRVPLDELCAAAFGEDAAVRTVARPDLEVATDCGALDLERLERHLDAVAEALRGLLPSLGRPRVPPRLVVFARDADYRRFTPGFARRFAAEASPPRSDGFTFAGIATASWSEVYGTLRPTYTHEFVHSWLARAAGLQNHGEWLQEGLASSVQLRFHPQEDLAAIVRQGLGDPRYQLPLERLCDGERIPLSRYWQAMTVVRFLSESPRFAPRFERLVVAFRTAGSTALAPHVEPVLGVEDLDALAAAWTAWCAAEYAEEAEKEQGEEDGADG